MFKEIDRYYRENYRTKVAIISRVLRDMSSAEDVVQEAFFRALKFHKSFDPKLGSLDKWFNSIMFNCLREHQRNMKGFHHSDSATISCEDVLGNIDVIHGTDKQSYLYSKIREVKNPEHKRVLMLFFRLGYTSKEISQIESGMSQSNVTTIVHRFKEGL